ncbi:MULTISPECIES: DUF951 domain-containing protein [unclassified Halanaerobium]|jgi:hypothetical protein|uniref:DUF951 domain-containing protein n=1 Tax=unclassified Halanaerobium TaxID=2641197 RepID=UPI000DF22BAA|nr:MULTISPECIES: DUF951 domain-containing protein [unclassified Halanaerobium]RCW40519.1 hypothetical protein DFR78_1481 [Halanaerobium sp. MA284_MarDTE_T2]RCW78293.1 hypothetical protein DER71_1571 [Halanaerobium sp. DL-01]
MSADYKTGDRVQFKKTHPCGGDIWKIIRVGMDFKAKCDTCGRIIMLPRKKFEKSVKKKLD